MNGNRTYAVVAASGDDGVQIMDITDPAHPAPVSAALDGLGFIALGGASDAEVFGMGDRTYAVVAVYEDDGVQILDITDPARPTTVSAALDGLGDFIALDGASDVEVFGVGDGTYAIVTAFDKNGILIMDITDPAHPTMVSAALDGLGFTALGGANCVEVFGIGGSTYAAVTAFNDGGVQIMDITDPAQPTPVSAALDGSDFMALETANCVEVFGMGGSTYAVVTASGEDGMQIMDITNPAHPAPASAAFDGMGGFRALDAADDVEVFRIGGSAYAVVTGADDDGVQIMDVTNPAQPHPVSAVFDGREFAALGEADDVEVFGSGNRTYAIVTARSDDGVLIMDVTNPAQPQPLSAVFDGREFTALGEAHDAEVFGNGDRAYAIVASYEDDGVQIMDITNPAQPYPVSAVFDGREFTALGGAYNVEVFGMGARGVCNSGRV